MGLFDGFLGDAFTMLNGGSQQESQTYINPSQQGYLADLYGAGQSVFNQIGSQQGQAGRSMGNALTNRGLNLGTQLSGAGQQMAPFTGSGYVMPQLQVLQQQLGQQASLGMNEIQNRFGVSGTIGSRAGAYGGELMEGLGRNMALGTADILQSDLARRQQAAATMGRQGIAGQMGALGSLGGLFNLSQAGYQSMWSPLNSLSGVLGQPTLLSQGNLFNAGQGLSANLNDSAMATGSIMGGIFGG